MEINQIVQELKQTSQKAPRKDWIGEWFKLKREIGNPNDIYITSGKFGQTSFEWMTLPHEYVDGVGGLAWLLIKQGQQITKLPEIKNKSKPSLINWIQFSLDLIDYLKSNDKKLKQIPWKKFNQEITRKSEIPRFRILESDMTNKIKNLAKMNQVSVNSILLWTLSKTCEKHLLESPRTQLWGMPVNMRGLVNLPNQFANHVSFSLVSFNPQDTFNIFHHKIKKRLESKSYFCIWKILNIGKYLGKSKLKKLAVKEKNSPNKLMGIFSNLGIWNPSDNKKGPDFWVAGDSTCSKYPIKAAVLGWKDCISISLNINPAVCSFETTTQEILNAWYDEINQLLSPQEIQ